MTYKETYIQSYTIYTLHAIKLLSCQYPLLQSEWCDQCLHYTLSHYSRQQDHFKTGLNKFCLE